MLNYLSLLSIVSCIRTGIASFLLFLFISSAAIAESEHSGHEDHNHFATHEHKSDHAALSNEAHNEGLSLSNAQLQEFGVERDILKAGVIRQQVSLPGRVRLNGESLAHITPRFPAKVLEVYARIGDVVDAGEVLALAESSDTLARFELRSVMKGQVIERHINLGEHLQPSDRAFVIADLTELWLDIALYPPQWSQVRQGQTLTIELPGQGGRLTSEIDYVAPVLDEATHTGLARVFLDNSEGHFKPGMYINTAITLSSQSWPIVVPRTAVVKLEGESVLFINHEGHWQHIVVEVESEDSGQLAIRAQDGAMLKPGEEYIKSGGFILKSMLSKSELDSGHNH